MSEREGIVLVTITNKIVPVQHAYSINTYSQITSNGGCRREEKSRKHWSFFTKFLFSVIANFSFVRSNQEQLYALIALKIREKKG